MFSKASQLIDVIGSYYCRNICFGGVLYVFPMAVY